MGLYCKFENPRLPMSLSYIHVSRNVFLLKIWNENLIISSKADGTDVKLKKSKKTSFSKQSENKGTLYLLNVFTYKSKESDKRCKQTMETFSIYKNDKTIPTMMPQITFSSSFMTTLVPTPNGDSLKGEVTKDFLPLYIGGAISFVILFIGCMIYFTIVKYPHGELSNWMENKVM